MAKSVDFEIVGSFNNQRFTTIDSERSVNLFEYIDPLGKKPKSLINTSGLLNTDLVFLGVTGGFRAQFIFLGNEYCVVQNKLFSINSSGILSTLGTLNTDVGYVGVDGNSFQVILVDGTNGYIWDTLSGKFVVITDTSFPVTPIDVCALDNFFVVANGNTNTFQLSLFDQGLVWGPDSQIFTASAATNLLTLGSTLNYQTGVPFTVSSSLKNISTFTVDITTDIFTIADTTNFAPTGTPVTVQNTGGLLPEPLKANTAYYTIIINSTTFTLANSAENAIAGVYIDILTAGTGTNSVVSATLPLPLNSADTYYAILVNSTTIRVATSYANAINNIFIDLTSDGTAPMTITSLGQLQQGSITSHPGTIVACRTLHRRLFLFSQFFTEVWENQGIGTNLPFRRNNSLLMEYGTPAIGSISTSFDVMIFLSNDRDGLGSVMMVRGTEAIPISNRALDLVLARYASMQQVSDCRSFMMKENGLIFYRMNFTLANHTFVYDVTLSDPSREETKYWHEEEVLNGDRHPAQTHAYFNGVNYVGNYLSPILYQVDNATFTNDGEAIKRMRITKDFSPPGYERIRVDRLQIDLLQGNVAIYELELQELDLLTEDSNIILTENNRNIVLEQELALDNAEELFVFLSISKDGGQTYGYSIKAPMGNIGQRTFRTLWRKLGATKRGQGFTAKFEFYNKVPFIILGASWCFEVLPE